MTNYLLPTYNKFSQKFIKGQGSVLFDDSGKKYLDFLSGIAVCNLGHSNPKLNNVLKNQAENLWHTSNLFNIEPQEILAKKLVESSFEGQVFFANSGAEANEGAIKIARKYGETKFNNKRYKVITLEHSFHGRTITTVKATGQKDMHTDSFSPYPDGFSYVNQIEDVYKGIDQETVAVLIELVQGEGGVQPFPKDEIVKLADYLKQEKVLLIVDEVQTGVYRTGKMLASNIYGIEPDIVTLAKGLGGGMPIGAVLTKHKDIFNAGDHGSTFGGNYMSTTAGLAVLKVLSELHSSGVLAETLDYFEDRLKDILNRYSNLFNKEVGIGLMRGLRAKDNDTMKAILANSMKERLIVLPAGRNTVRFLPSLTITKSEIDEGFKRFEKAIASL